MIRDKETWPFQQKDKLKQTRLSLHRDDQIKSMMEQSGKNTIVGKVKREVMICKFCGKEGQLANKKSISPGSPTPVISARKTPGLEVYVYTHKYKYPVHRLIYFKG